MADNFRFELVSPERLLVSEAATQVTVPGAEGEFTVLPGHAPFVSTLRPGLLTVSLQSGGRDEYVLFGGFAEVGPDALTVLAEQAQPRRDLDAEEIAARVRDAEEDVNDATDDAARARAQERLDQLRALQQFA